MKDFQFIALYMAAVFAVAACGKEEPEAEKPKVAQESNANIVTLSDKKLQHAQIQAQVVGLGSIDTALKASGRVSENLNKTAKIASTLEGRLIKLNFDINDAVKTGDVLALVQTPELLGKPLELKAPLDGVVIERKSTVGELVDKASEIYIISDPADLWVLAEIRERDIAAVKVGQEASFTVLPFPNEKFNGKVVRIGNQVEIDSRTLEVRIDVENREGRLKPGMFADVEITTGAIRDVLVVPDNAIQSDGADQIVFVAADAHHFEKRVVTLGRNEGGTVQVLEGVKAGEKVVTEGSFILKSEMLKGEMADED
jgi:multidrug efflux pump subunit AcrA (membrane-fusion protein)